MDKQLQKIYADFQKYGDYVNKIKKIVEETKIELEKED